MVSRSKPSVHCANGVQPGLMVRRQVGGAGIEGARALEAQSYDYLIYFSMVKTKVLWFTSLLS